MPPIAKTIILEKTMFSAAYWDQLCDMFYAANSQSVDSLVLVVTDYKVCRTYQGRLQPGKIQITPESLRR